jgi:hypothetical protein
MECFDNGRSTEADPYKVNIFPTHVILVSKCRISLFSRKLRLAYGWPRGLTQPYRISECFGTGLDKEAGSEICNLPDQVKLRIERSGNKVPGVGTRGSFRIRLPLQLPGISSFQNQLVTYQPFARLRSAIDLPPESWCMQTKRVVITR